MGPGECLAQSTPQQQQQQRGRPTVLPWEATEHVQPGTELLLCFVEHSTCTQSSLQSCWVCPLSIPRNTNLQPQPAQQRPVAPDSLCFGDKLVNGNGAGKERHVQGLSIA
ncbi:unnamed protein product [Pleuronectes platessa]|uniref:Uncharacterized protein n=1 Tax=Pleuronectes platessa TaxID=8262 RepID=A0A9N7TMF4_PLEPL|nr:unnamed protein product [Pleuronectes platessa]